MPMFVLNQITRSTPTDSDLSRSSSNLIDLLGRYQAGETYKDIYDKAASERDKARQASLISQFRIAHPELKDYSDSDLVSAIGNSQQTNQQHTSQQQNVPAAKAVTPDSSANPSVSVKTLPEGVSKNLAAMSSPTASVDMNTGIVYNSPEEAQFARIKKMQDSLKSVESSHGVAIPGAIDGKKAALRSTLIQQAKSAGADDGAAGMMADTYINNLDNGIVNAAVSVDGVAPNILQSFNNAVSASGTGDGSSVKGAVKDYQSQMNSRRVASSSSHSGGDSNEIYQIWKDQVAMPQTDSGAASGDMAYYNALVKGLGDAASMQSLTGSPTNPIQSSATQMLQSVIAGDKENSKAEIARLQDITKGLVGSKQSEATLQAAQARAAALKSNAEIMAKARMYAADRSLDAATRKYWSDVYRTRMQAQTAIEQGDVKYLISLVQSGLPLMSAQVSAAARKLNPSAYTGRGRSNSQKLTDESPESAPGMTIEKMQGASIPQDATILDYIKSSFGINQNNASGINSYGSEKLIFPDGRTGHFDHFTGRAFYDK